MHRAIDVARDGPLPRHCPVEGIVPCVVPVIRRRAGPVGSLEHRRCEHRGGTQVPTLGPINDSVTYVDQRYINEYAEITAQTLPVEGCEMANSKTMTDAKTMLDTDTAIRIYLFNVESAKRRERVKTLGGVSYLALREYTPERVCRP